MSSGPAGGEARVLEPMISLTKPRSRRLRKKLRLGEFQEVGFEVTITLHEGLDETRLTAFWDDFIREAIERNGLAYGGGISGFVTSVGLGSATVSQQEAVLTWFRERSEVQSADVGLLIDAWYGGS